MKKINIILLILIVITSCVEKYWPEIDSYENLLVVDGLLTNGDEPAVVKLSISSSINNEKLIPLSNAELFITDKNNYEIPLSETDLGTYIVSDSSFRGQAGNSYQLHIHLPDGRNYISEICELASQCPIDSVYGEIESPEISNSDHQIEGIQFYTDFHCNDADTCYYMWKLSQTYKYQSTFDIDWVWEGYFYPFPNPDSLHTCWNTVTVNEIFTFTNKFINQSKFDHFPLVYRSTEGKMLSIRYRLLVKQLSISENTYNFWEALDQQNIDQGNLYSKQPIQIRGNVSNIANPDEAVLGYFTVAGVSEKIIYVNRPPLNFYYNICTPDYDLRFIRFEPESMWPIYVDDIMFTGWAINGSYVCFDCRLEVVSLTPPDFWEE